METAYRLAYSRVPDSWEKDTVATFFHKQKAVIEARVQRGEKLALPASTAGRRGSGLRGGVRGFLPDAAELERIRLPELSQYDEIGSNIFGSAAAGNF